MPSAPLEFVVGDYTYHSDPMNAWTQFRLMRKASPIVAAGLLDFIPLMQDVARFGVAEMATAEAKVEASVPNAAGALPLARLVQILLPVSRELAKLPEEDFQDIIRSCLSLCKRRQVGSDARTPLVGIWNAQAQVAVMDDIKFDAMLMLDIAWPVFIGNLKGFFTEGRSRFVGAVAG